MICVMGSPVLVHPTRRPGALPYLLIRLRSMVRPPVTVYEPAEGSVLVDRDLEVAVRDGTVLRVNVHRPPGAGPFPVLLSAHPYGKDALPKRTRRGFRVSAQYRGLRQTDPISFSSLTSWEAPDPVWWTQHGYAVVNADLRGAGHSDGRTELLSKQEGEDVADLIEWAGTQPWGTGRVGLLGVSYLAVTQYEAAACKSGHLAAICPWEGFTDPYRDLFCPGGIPEYGFASLWLAATKRTVRLAVDFGAERRHHLLRDRWWQSHVPKLSDIDVPMLVCATFSDNCLHSRGSFRAFQQVGSARRFAYTHRGGKWATFYGDPARQAQLAFLDRHVAERDAPDLPPVRLEVRESRDRIVEVRDEQEWPLALTQWTPVHLGPEGALTEVAPSTPGQLTFDPRRRAAAFSWRIPHDVELSGPMAARLWVEVHDTDDADLVVGVEKWRGRRIVPFEGSYGWGRDRVTTGWQKASLRAVDAAMSAPHAPVHTYDQPEPLGIGDVVPVDVALGPSATLFRAGEVLRLLVAGRWLSPRNPFTGQLPARYRCRPRGRCTLHWGPERPAHVLVPVIPAR